MITSISVLRPFILLSAVSAAPNLFIDEQLQPILGTQFGVPGKDAIFDYVIVGGCRWWKRRVNDSDKVGSGPVSHRCSDRGCRFLRD